MEAYYPIRSGILHMIYEDEKLKVLDVLREDAGLVGICREEGRSDFSERVRRQICEYLDGQRTAFEVECEPEGTAFQRQVWKALQEIPFGETRTYGQIAEFVGRPKAVRAVGGACHNNPIWVMIPCHRVVGANGSLTGYAGGLDMKEALLDLEQSVVRRKGVGQDGIE